jgi:WD40 repeat protein
MTGSGPSVNRLAVLLATLRRTQLLDGPILDEVARRPEAAGDDPRPLGRYLLQRGLLTRYQLNQLAQGHDGDLVLGPYRLLDRLDEGQAPLYRAQHATTGAAVLLQRLRTSPPAPAAVREWFQRQLRAVGPARHPHLVPLHDAEQSGDTPYLAFESVEGASARQMVEEGGPLPAPVAGAFVRQAAAALAVLHARGAVHGRLSPRHVFIAPLAVTSGGAPRPDASALARLIGLDLGWLDGTGEWGDAAAARFRAPELATPGTLPDPLADQYGLGGLLYYLLTGQPPAAGGDRLPATVPPPLAAITRRLLARDPAQRFASASEVETALAAPTLAAATAVAADPGPPISPFAAVTDAEAAAPPEDETADDFSVPSATVSVPAAARRRGPAGKPSRRWLGIGIGAALHLGAIALLWAVISGRAGQWFRSSASDTGARDTTTVARDAPKHASAVKTGPTGRPAEVAKSPAEPAPDEARGNPPPSARPNGLPPLNVSPPTATVGASVGGPMPAKVAIQVRDFEPKHGGPVHALALLPGGRQLLSAGADQQLRLWDAATGQVLRTFTGTPHSVLALAANGLGTLAASAGADGAVRVWDVALGRERFTLTGHAGPVRGVAFSPNGEYILSGSEDRTLRVWELASRLCVREIKVNQPVVSVAFGPDGRRGLAGGDYGTVAVYDLDTAQPLYTLGGHIGPVHGVAFSPDGRQAVSVGEDKTLRFWDVVTGARGLRRTAPQPLRAVSYAGDGSWVVAVGVDSAAYLAPARAGTFARIGLPDRGTPLALAVAPDAGALFLGTDQAEVRRVDLQGGPTEVATRPANPTRPPAPPPRPAPRTVRAPAAGGLAPIWTGSGLFGTLSGVAFSRDSHRLVTGGAFDRQARVWDVVSGRELASAFNLGLGAVLNANGSQIVGIDRGMGWVGGVHYAKDCSIKLHVLDTGRDGLVGIHAQPVTCVALSPDGRRVLSGSFDETACVWDIVNGRQLKLLKRHKGAVRAVEFCPKQVGAMLQALSAGDDGTVRFWDVNTGRELGKIDGLAKEAVHTVHYSADGRSILVADRSTLSVYEAVTGKPIRQVRPTGQGEGYNLRAACWAPNGTAFIVVPELSAPLLIDAETGKELARFDRAVDVQAVAVSPDGRFVAAAGRGLWVYELDKALTPAPSSAKDAPAGGKSP